MAGAQRGWRRRVFLAFSCFAENRRNRVRAVAGWQARGGKFCRRDCSKAIEARRSVARSCHQEQRGPRAKQAVKEKRRPTGVPRLAVCVNLAIFPHDRSHPTDDGRPELAGHPGPSAPRRCSSLCTMDRSDKSVSGFGPVRRALERHPPPTNNDQGGANYGSRSGDRRITARVSPADFTVSLTSLIVGAR